MAFKVPTFIKGLIVSLSLTTYISINVCPRCNGRLDRKRIDGKLIVSCRSCGNSYQILEK